MIPASKCRVLSGEELLRDMQGTYAMVVNAYEAEIICKKTGQSLDDLRRAIRILVITQGKRGSHIYQNGELTEVAAFPTERSKTPPGRRCFPRWFAAGHGGGLATQVVR